MMKRITIGNKKRPHIRLVAGEGEPTRVIGAVGISPEVTSVDMEFSKAKVAVKYGADLIDEESIVEPDGSRLRDSLLGRLKVPISTVPLFETCACTLPNGGDGLCFEEEDILNTVQKQANQGADVMTLHIAYSREMAEMLTGSKRAIPLTSRSGAILTSYMLRTGRENPYRLILPEILDVLRGNSVVLSLGTALRPGSVCDGLDDLYFAELSEQGRIVEKAWEEGVSVMVEAAGHVRIDKIGEYVRQAKKAIHGAPLRSLGPTPCDIGTGYDHVTGSIGGALAAMSGCDFLTCTTRAEHIGLPRIQDVKEGVIAFKLAGYIGDTAKRGDVTRDRAISEARNRGDWEGVWKASLFGEEEDVPVSVEGSMTTPA